MMKRIVATALLTALLLSPAVAPGANWLLGCASAQAQAPTPEQAFAAAKELGTAEAWNAFLANYPDGFHADLARAYLKKLGDQPEPSDAATANYPPPDFPIVAGSWGGIVRDGPGPEHRKVDSLDEGQQVTLMARTEVVENGFPWFKIAYANDGKGYQWGGILCAVGEERPDVFKTCPAAKKREPEKSAKKESEKKDSEPRKEAKSCGSGRVRIDGKCVAKGAAASFCGPGYRPEGGKCVQGYQAPKAGTPLSAEQKSAVSKGCPKGQVWNAAEGCHHDD